MNITFKITEYPGVQGCYWAVLKDGIAMDTGHEPTRQDALNYMSDMCQSLTGERFNPHYQDTRWKRIEVLEIHSRDFS